MVEESGAKKKNLEGLEHKLRSGPVEINSKKLEEFGGKQATSGELDGETSSRGCFSGKKNWLKLESWNQSSGK